MTDALRLACWVAILAAAVLPATVYAGDEDSKPAYMIYINPETGKYTTEDPDAGNSNVPVVPARPASGDSNPGSPLFIVIGAVLAALLVGAMLKHQRRQHSRQQ